MANDFSVSIKLDAGVVGLQEVKNFASVIERTFQAAITGGGSAASAAGKTGEALDKAKAAVTGFGRELMKVLNADMTGSKGASSAVTDGLKKGLEAADASVKKLTADLQALYAQKATGNPTAKLNEDITATEQKLKAANRELARFKNLSNSGGGGGGGFGGSGGPPKPEAPTPSAPIPGIPGGAGMGSLIGGLTAANLLAQAITASFGAMKDAVSAVVSEGMKMNEFLETANLGIATSVYAQYNLKDAQGKTLEGQEAYAAAMELSQEQVKQLRIAGLETAATTQELAKSFQTAMSVGASQKITDLDQIRQLTVDATNAATALGVSQAEVPVAIRAIITGQEVEANTLARILVGSGEQVRSWQQQGKLVEELNKRLKPFSEGAKNAANSWAVVKSNIEESFQVFAGESTSGMFKNLKETLGGVLAGVFDTKNLGISKDFAAISDIAKTAFDGVGVVISDIILGVVDLAKKFNSFLTENASTIEEWKQGFRDIWLAVKESFRSIVDLTRSLLGAKKETGEMSLLFTMVSLTLKGIALLIAGVADGVRTIGSAVIWVSGLLMDIVLKPISFWLDKMGTALNLVKSGWGDGLLSVGKTLDEVGGKTRKFAGELIAPIADGDGAVKRLLRSFEETGKAADTMGGKAKKALKAVVDSAKNPQEKKAGMSAQSAIAKAEADAAIAIAKDRLQREQRELDYQLSNQLVSIKDYYAKRRAMQLEALQADLAAKTREEAGIRASTPKSKDDELNKKAQLIKLQAEMTILRAKEGDIINENIRKENDATIALTQKVLEIRAALEQSTGASTFETMGAQVAEKFRVIRAQFVQEFGEDSEAVGLVDKLVDVETSKGKFAILQQQYNQTLDAMRIKEEEILRAEASGAMGPLEAFREMNNLHAATATELEKLIPLMEQYALATGDPAMVNNVKRLKMELADTTATQSELAKSVGQGLTNNLTTFFADLASGAKKGSDAVKDFGRAVLATITQIIAQETAMMAVKAMFRMAAAGGGPVKAAGGGPIHRSDGGPVWGAGTSTSDSIPALLSDGEFVIKASAVKRLGIGFLTMLNGITSSNHGNRFADGGPVTSNVGPGATQVQANTKVVNVFDTSLLQDYLATPKGERAILNVISSNPQFMRAVMR